MTATILSRDRGAALRCNYDGCPHGITTAQIQAGLIRAYAASVGWIRGLDSGSGSPDTGGRPANRRWDICPEHAVVERERAKQRKLAADERRKERTKPPTPEVLAARTRRARRKANAAKYAALAPQVSA
jgi:sRNA-binding protein